MSSIEVDLAKGFLCWTTFQKSSMVEDFSQVLLEEDISYVFYRQKNFYRSFMKYFTCLLLSRTSIDRSHFTGLF